jgi:hypothetical protein
MDKKPLIRKVFPELVASDIVKVQPMTNKTNFCFNIVDESLPSMCAFTKLSDSMLSDRKCGEYMEKEVSFGDVKDVLFGEPEYEEVVKKYIKTVNQYYIYSSLGVLCGSSGIKITKGKDTLWKKVFYIA